MFYISILFANIFFINLVSIMVKIHKLKDDLSPIDVLYFNVFIGIVSLSLFLYFFVIFFI